MDVWNRPSAAYHVSFLTPGSTTPHGTKTQNWCFMQKVNPPPHLRGVITIWLHFRFLGSDIHFLPTELGGWFGKHKLEMVESRWRLWARTGDPEVLLFKTGAEMLTGRVFDVMKLWGFLLWTWQASYTLVNFMLPSKNKKKNKITSQQVRQ